MPRRFPLVPRTTAPSSARSSRARTAWNRTTSRAAYEAVRAWRLYEPPVDLYVLPCVSIDLPPEGVDEREIRFELSAYVRWVNLIGWAGLAIGNLQLVAPHDETVLAAGLAWERG